jgi:hypothetical protein
MKEESYDMDGLVKEDDGEDSLATFVECNIY